MQVTNMVDKLRSGTSLEPFRRSFIDSSHIVSYSYIQTAYNYVLLRVHVHTIYISYSCSFEFNMFAFVLEKLEK